MHAEEEVELRHLRTELEENVKPIFDNHQGSFPVGELRSELEYGGLLESLPKDSVQKLLAQDKDKVITYKEFVRIMTEDLSREVEQPFHTLMRTAIAAVIPDSEREDFLANYNCCPPPIFIPLITVAEIIVFIVYVYDLRGRGFETTAYTGTPMYSPLVYKPERRYEVWRFITYMLVHQGYMHIVSNTIYQLIFGIPLEVVHKGWRVGLVYLLGVLAGSLASSVTDYRVSVVGASGGVYALLGAHVAAIIINWKEMNYKCMDAKEMKRNICCGISRFLLSAPVRLAIVLLLVFADTAQAIYRRVTIEDDGKKIAVTAHMGGFFAGIMMGIVLLKNINQLTWEKNVLWVALSLFLAFVAFCCLFNALFDGYPPTDWS